MKLSYYEVVDLERFLGTLASCDYMGVAPKLSEADYFIVSMMQGHFVRWLREQERG
jgi:hypothetical protein